MAYSLQPLIQILEQILNPQHHPRLNWSLDPCKRPGIESLLAKAHFLNVFLGNPSSVTGHSVRRLENRIRDAACHAIDIIESHLVDQILSQKEKGESIIISPPDFLRVIEEEQFQRILGEMAEIIRDGRVASSSSSNLYSSRQDLYEKTVVVGLNEGMIQLKEQLITSQESKLEIIPIVGMGGIGKTTLARALYDDPDVASYFDKRAWTGISQIHNEMKMLMDLLECISDKMKYKMVYGDCSELGLLLYKTLWGRRYLIVLDDIWSDEAWDCVKMFFPDENNGSRILVTTREQNVANNVAGFENYHHQMKLLNEIESWELLRRTVNPEGQFSLELESAGKNIARKCRGLPLAINVVGGILSLLDKTPEAWVQVAEDFSSVLANEDEISNILSLSYNHLPNYLKPCFLYIGAFPKDFKIKESKLIRLWMAEGFIKTIPGMSLEETASIYLMKLVQSNLLSIDRQRSSWYAESYIMHDVLRELCIRKAQEENFLYVGSDAIRDLNPNYMLPLRLSFHRPSHQVTRIMESSDILYGVRSLLLFPGCDFQELPWTMDDVVRMRLLKVLDIMSRYRDVVFPKEMERLVNLRYLAVNNIRSVAYPISSLCNLQTLIFGDHYYGSFDGIVKELLDMPQLRHVKFKGFPYPLFHLEDGESVGVAEQLQSLYNVAIDDSFPQIIKAIPNLKKLGIHWDRLKPLSSNIDLSSVNQLQILKCSWMRLAPHSELILPGSLKKLTLYLCDNIPVGFLDEIGRLPNLEVLVVNNCDGTRVWKPTEGQFQQLRVLHIRLFYIRRWIADETHYPRLQHLIIDHCLYLKEIPSAIGDIPTLKIIDLVGDSTASALKSAKKIQNNQIEYGNDDLQVRINASVPRERDLRFLQMLNHFEDLLAICGEWLLHLPSRLLQLWG